MRQILIILLALLSLVGCSSTLSSNSTVTQIETTAEKPSETTQPTLENIQPLTIEQTTIPTTELSSTPSEQVKATDLFETIYVPYANGKNATTFDSVKAFAETSNYKSEVVEPTDEVLGTIKLYDENGDYIYFGFNQVDDVETIITVSFYQATNNIEVSMSNYSTDKSSLYDNYYTHTIGEAQKKVNGTDEQRKFLFN